MENLFSHGTLHDPDVQRATFGRTVESFPDALAGFTVEEITDSDGKHHRRAVPSAGSLLTGFRLEVNEADLEKADAYEGTAYTRTKELLESGIEAWAYVRAA